MSGQEPSWGPNLSSAELLGPGGLFTLIRNLPTVPGQIHTDISKTFYKGLLLFIIIPFFYD